MTPRAKTIGQLTDRIQARLTKRGLKVEVSENVRFFRGAPSVVQAVAMAPLESDHFERRNGRTTGNPDGCLAKRARCTDTGEARSWRSGERGEVPGKRGRKRRRGGAGAL